jgi:hypothetical protein
MKADHSSTRLGSILRSTDQGATWSSTLLPFKVGGNMPGRGVGEVCLFTFGAETLSDAN